MRKIFTLVITLLFSITLFANARTGRLSISAAGSNPVRILVDGNVFSDRFAPEDEVWLSDIRAGYHNVRIYRLQQRNRRSNRESQLIYEGNIYVKPGYHVDVCVNRFGKAYVDERRISDGDFTWNDDHGYHNNNIAMDRNSFDQLKRTLAGQVYESTRLNIAKQAIARHFFNTDQVIELAALFTYESNKLDIAKYCYAFTTDRNNYYRVSDVLTYNSSKEELIRFIQTTR